MLISVQADRPSARLPGAHLLPKALVWFALVKSRVLIVRDDRQNRPNAFFNHDVFEFLPDCPIDRRAHVVESQQELDTHLRALPFFLKSVISTASGIRSNYENMVL
jgi:hypothetical protein